MNDNIYYLIAKAAHPEIDLTKYQSILESAKDHFNERSMYSRNRKKIDTLSINKESLSITLLSTTEVDTNQISRALRVFTEYLIKNAAELVYNKRIFHIRAVSNSFYKDLEHAPEITDEEMMSILLHHILNPSNNGRAVIMKVKSILKEADYE